MTTDDPAAAIRPLGPGDLDALLALRAESLLAAPCAFAADPESDVLMSPPDFVRQGLAADPARDPARDRRRGRRLTEAAIGHARSMPGVRQQTNLEVGEAAPEAERLHRAVGFRHWGTEPRGLHVEGRDLDLHHFWLPFDRPASDG